MTAPPNDPKSPPYRRAGVVLLLAFAAVLALVFFQFRGDFQRRTPLTLVSARSGLVMDLGSKVTYNGVEIGRVTAIQEVTVRGRPKAKLTLGVDPQYVNMIPRNVSADIKATTVFGNKYVELTSPESPAQQRITSSDVIAVSDVTTEFNTVFETVMEIAQRVDPIKLNATLSATAQALGGFDAGNRFGESLIDGNEILADLNPRMSQLGDGIERLADVADVYSDAAPDFFAFLRNAASTAGTLNERQSDLTAALMAAIGFANPGTETIEEARPFLVRASQDLIPTSQLLDEYSPSLFCTIRNFAEVAPKIEKAFGGNGYSLSQGAGTIAGAANPYVYPDNLPRVNASGGPEGRPGCWAPVTKDLWPAPYLVMDTGASIAPYNGLKLGQPIVVDHVWGRQIGEYTINP